MSRRLYLTTCLLIALTLCPSQLLAQSVDDSANNKLYIASDRATLKIQCDHDIQTLEEWPYTEADKANAFSRKRLEGTIKSAFFTDNGQDDLSWVITDDDKNFSQTDLAEFVQNARGKHIVLFVHGCCVSFKEMEHQARDLQRELAKAMGKDVILLAYDWATPALMYTGSLRTMGTTQGRFNIFMDDLRKSLPGQKISLVMHSLGGNLFLRYLTESDKQMLVTRNEKPFNLLIFSRPDMSFETFRPHLAEVAATGNESFILAAENDININLSGFVRSLKGKTFGSFRLGQFHNARELTPQLKVMDVSTLRQGHLILYKLIANLLANF